MSAVLTEEERNILILSAVRPNGNCLNYSDIAQCLDISVIRVKRLMHRIFKKLNVTNRIEAIRAVRKKGEIRLDEIYSLDEMLEIFSSLSHDMWMTVAHLVRQGQENNHLPGNDVINTHKDSRRCNLLTNSERDVILCVGLGLTNKEIADRLCLSATSVTTFLYRAYQKLGAHNRANAFMLALKQKEISLNEHSSSNELAQIVATLRVEYTEGLAQLMNKKLGQESTPTYCFY